MKKAVSLIIILFCIMLIPTVSSAASFYCNCTTHGGSGKGLLGIFHAMLMDGSGWLKTTPVTGLNFRSEAGAEDLPENKEGYSMIKSRGAVCFGHATEDVVAGKGMKRVRAVVDIDENTRSSKTNDQAWNEQKLAYYIYWSTRYNETGNSGKGKGRIIAWIHKYYTKYYKGVIQNKNGAEVVEGDTSYALNYAENINSEKLTTDDSKSNPTITVQGDYTYIGPYNLQQKWGNLTKAEIKTKDNKTISTTQCVTGTLSESNIKSMTSVSTYSGNSFYVVVKSTDITSVDSIKVYKQYSAIHARIVLAEATQAGGQNVAVFYGEYVKVTGSVTLPGVASDTNFTFTKIDANTKKPLTNIGLVVYNEEKGYIQDGEPATYTQDINEATVYKTDSNGKIEVNHVSEKGNYIIYEVENPNFGYEEVSMQNPLNIYEFTLDSVGKDIVQNVENKREYIKLSGYAWEEKYQGKGGEKDYVYTSDSEDKRLQNVTVTLKKSDGSTIASTVTDANGEYKFGNYDEDPNVAKVRIDDLVGAYVEFEYNGMSYQSIIVQEDVENGNKATDEASRDEFNNNYSTIGKGISSDSNGNKTYDIRYNTHDYVSEVIYGDSPIYGYDGQKYPITGVDGQYSIQAITAKKSSNILYTEYTADSLRSDNITEITNINLGVEEREMPDLTIVQDLEKVEINLNDYTHIYEYEQRFKNADEYAGGDGFDIGVKFGNKYISNSYSREVYASDIVYNKSVGNEGKLKLYMTYKIQIKNEATTLHTTLKTLSNYYDSRYESVTVRNENGEIVSSTTDDTYNVDGLNRVNINLNQQIDAQTMKTMTITYQLSDEAVNNILNGNETLQSVSEVTSYSSYSDEYQTAYAGIDIDSAPDNVNPNDLTTFEDDTDKAPSLILTVKDSRVIKGTVWEDSAIEELLENEGENKERKGDGVYQTTENIVNNVKVELMTVDESGNLELAKLYNRDGTVVNATATTSGKGEYTLEGMIPDVYVLRYTYGNNSVICDSSGNMIENVSANSYKSTIYRGGDKDAAESMTDYWYRDETSENSAQRLSDAKDNQDYIDNRVNEEGGETYETVSDMQTYTEIMAETRQFEIELEYDIDVNVDNISKYNGTLKYIFDNIDFGITKRPEQGIEIKKEVANINLALANGATLIEGDPRVQTLSGVKVLDDDVYIEMENELIQGATLKITYEITVSNKNCETDYNDDDYYIYGKVPDDSSGTGTSTGQMAAIKDIFDYLPEDMVLSSTSGNWEKIEITEDMKGTILSEEVYNAIKDQNNVVHLRNPIFESMAPNSEVTDTSLVVTKQLSTSSEDLTYENDLEVIELASGRITGSIPGNYNPVTNTPNELDDDSVAVIITAPTGGNRQYWVYGVIGISLLVIIGVGIVIIKRKVLKN